MRNCRTLFWARLEVGGGCIGFSRFLVNRGAATTFLLECGVVAGLQGMRVVRVFKLAASRGVLESAKAYTPAIAAETGTTRKQTCETSLSLRLRASA